MDIYESIQTLRLSKLDFKVMIKLINKWQKSLKDTPSDVYKLKIIEDFERENKFSRQTNDTVIYNYANCIVNEQQVPAI
jgi:hypothetical protein